MKGVAPNTLQVGAKISIGASSRRRDRLRESAGGPSRSSLSGDGKRARSGRARGSHTRARVPSHCDAAVMPKNKSGEEAKVPLQAVVLADSFTHVRAPPCPRLHRAG